MIYRNRQALAILLSLLLFFLAASAVHAQNAAVTITVYSQLSRHPISPDIYGTCTDPTNSNAFSAALADLNCPINRLGGNITSTYNWQINAYNHASDWYFESDSWDSSAAAGEAGDTFILQSKAAGAQAMLTIPMVGWVAKLAPNRDKLCSFSIAKYGPQTGNDWEWFPDAGNGILLSNGKFVVGNDPNDAYVPSDVGFQTGWVNHLISTWGKAAAGGLRYYILDNELAFWHDTHRDIHPIGAKMAEVRDKIISYSQAIKGLDPAALVVGPEECNWFSYFFSGYDLWYGNNVGWGINPDRTANGGMDYLPWLLDQIYQNDQITHQRTLDVFSVHYYPQGAEYSNDVSTDTQLLRNRSTRSLWDPNYFDTNINAYVELIYRLQGWVIKFYPTTPPKLAITEYSWGADAHINGATAQADILGIFGREGLDMATPYTTPDPATPTYKAIKMYRNYDGLKSTFGDTSIFAQAPYPPNDVAVFAAERSKDGALTIMVISKDIQDAGPIITTPITVNLADFPKSAKASVWQLTAANNITRLPDIQVSGGSFATTVPNQSITLFVVKPPAVIPAIDLLLGD
jgi:hypothetical protein